MKGTTVIPSFLSYDWTPQPKAERYSALTDEPDSSDNT